MWWRDIVQKNEVHFSPNLWEAANKWSCQLWRKMPGVKFLRIVIRIKKSDGIKKSTSPSSQSQSCVFRGCHSRSGNVNNLMMSSGTWLSRISYFSTYRNIWAYLKLFLDRGADPIKTEFVKFFGAFFIDAQIFFLLMLARNFYPSTILNFLSSLYESYVIIVLVFYCCYRKSF